MPTQALDESLAEMFNETVTIEISTGITDKYGQGGYADPKPYPARLDADIRSIRKPDGEEAVSMLQVYVLSLDTHTTEDRLTLPAGRVPDQPPVMSVEPIQDELGVTMVVFYT